MVVGKPVARVRVRVRVNRMEIFGCRSSSTAIMFVMLNEELPLLFGRIGSAVRAREVLEYSIFG